MKTSTILLITILMIFVFYIINKKENLSNTEKKTSEMLIPNCNMLNGYELSKDNSKLNNLSDTNYFGDNGETCKNTKGCVYNKQTQGCYYDWINII
jgi:competence protein ComGC